MSDANPRPGFFAVTTPGRTATRWLSHVLASQPSVFVAHGKFALDSVIDADFSKEKEKETAFIQALSRGNELRDFYESRSLEEVLAVYQTTKPGAHAYGCVHSYTIHTLAQAARSPETLNQIRVLNVVRHPVDFIASHFGLVRAAEKYPPLYQYYLHDVFPRVLQQFPELYLMRCPDYRDFVAFAISCWTVNNLLYDLCYPGIRHLKMETLTTQVEVLGEFCHDLTGLTYPCETLEGFIRQGAINQHQPRRSTSNPHESYATWESWQQDLAHMMISGLALDWLQELGYDVSMFRAHARAAGAGHSVQGQVPCLCDCLRSLDPRHPHLAYLTPSGSTRIQAIELDFRGFQLVRTGGKVYALARSLHMEDIATADEKILQDLREDGLCLGGDSVGEVWRAIARVIAGANLIGAHRSYNVITFNEAWYGIAQGEAVDLERLKSPARKQLIKDNKLVVGETVAKVKQQIDAILLQEEMCRQQEYPLLVESGYRGYNVVLWQDAYYGVARAIGAIDLPSASNSFLSEYTDRGWCVIGRSLNEAKEKVDREVDRMYWQKEMSRQREMMKSTLHRWLGTTRKNLGRLKRRMFG